MDAFENYFAGLRNKSIAVLGLGVSNRPLVRLLLEFGCQVTGCDKTPREQLDEEVLELEKLGCKLHVGPDYLEGVQAEILFRTPGMHPNNPAIEALRQRGAQVTSEMEVFFEVCPCNLIAVTGSDGKTTTRFFSRKQKTNCVWEENGVIYRRGERLLETKEILIPGTHNIENYMAAIALVEGLATDDAIRQVARNFGGVEHRIELVRVKDGVRYYNDSIASSPSRTIAGLRSFPEKVILIAGGYDKHIPYDVLGPEICAHVKKLFLGGATGPKIRAAVENAPAYLPGMPEIVDCGDFTKATLAAARAAEPGDVVLMSPASAAFDQFKNFMVRGQYFKKLVKEL